MGEPRENAGGSKLWHEGERVSYTDLNRMGSVMQRDMLHLLAEVFRDDSDGDPRSGVFGDSFLCTNPAGYDIETALGLGLYYDSAETNDWAAHYKPVALEAAETNTLDACEPALDRYDRISIAPATDDDTPETDNIRDPATGTVSSQSKDQRRRWYGTVTVTKGIPGAGIPALPAGHLPVCTVTLPGGGAAPSALTDDRVKLTIALEKLDSREIYLDVTVGALQAGPPKYRELTIQAKYVTTDEDVDDTVAILVRVLNDVSVEDVNDAYWGPVSVGGTEFGLTAPNGAFWTDVHGAATIRITDAGATGAATAILTPKRKSGVTYYSGAPYTEGLLMA